MKCVFLGILFLCGEISRCQTGSLQVPAAGLETPWSVQKIIADLQKDSAQLQPLLQQMNPQQWYDQKGAPSTYMVQWQAAQQQSNDVATVTKAFAQKSESLSSGLDVYFRLEALETTERALSEGAQKYDTHTTSDKLNALIAHNFDSRQRLRDYLRDLAASTEQNFKIADAEAQRCRGMISKELPSNSKAKSKR